MKNAKQINTPAKTTQTTSAQSGNTKAAIQIKE
jgi:hypothetical protein